MTIKQPSISEMGILEIEDSLLVPSFPYKRHRYSYIFFGSIFGLSIATEMSYLHTNEEWEKINALWVADQSMYTLLFTLLLFFVFSHSKKSYVLDRPPL